MHMAKSELPSTDHLATTIHRHVDKDVELVREKPPRIGASGKGKKPKRSRRLRGRAV